MQLDRKPLTARSVLASVLLGADPPWLPTALLVRTAQLFGIAEGTVRTALSRMSAAGELVGRDGGYELAGHLRSRQSRQQVSRRAETRSWDGTWELAVLERSGPRSPADRAALRRALVVLRLAELHSGVWARPDNLDPQRAPDARAVASDQVRWWSGARPDQDDGGVEALWDLATWAEGAARLRAEMAALARPLETGDTAALAEGFVTSAAVLRHLQADPLLPTQLLPHGWPGDLLRSEYDRYDAAYRAVLRDWFARTDLPT